jgi:aryl-alcohol dehydrogenase-like predicted oxidoreductase
MERRELGSSGFEISRIGLGTWAIGGHMGGGQDEAQSVEAIHAAVAYGINWIDTAPIYGSGHSEEVVGRAVKALPARQRPMIFTKFGLGTDSEAPQRSAAATEVTAECEASLRRLGVEHIDLYQLHWPAPQPIAETAAACGALLRAGQIQAASSTCGRRPAPAPARRLQTFRRAGAPVAERVDGRQGLNAIERPALRMLYLDRAFLDVDWLRNIAGPTT